MAEAVASRDGPLTLLTTDTTVITAGADYVWVKKLIIANDTSLSVLFTCSIGADAVGTRLFDVYPIAPNDTLIYRVKHLLKPGELLVASAGTASALVATAFSIKEKAA